MPKSDLARTEKSLDALLRRRPSRLCLPCLSNVEVLPATLFCLKTASTDVVPVFNGCRQASRSLAHLVLSHTPGKTPATCHFPAEPWQISSFTIAHQSVVRSSIMRPTWSLLSDGDRLRFEKDEIGKHVCASGPNTVLTERAFCT